MNMEEGGGEEGVEEEEKEGEGERGIRADGCCMKWFSLCPHPLLTCT
mgnify:CR=1 FL=1